MTELVGHTTALELLRRLQASGRLGSGLVIVGAEGVGKRFFAETVFGIFATNPNAMMLERALNDKDELKKNIGIEQVRELVARMSMSSFGDGKKIGVIDGAEYLSTDAANALLKTLEDPRGDSLLILLTTSTNAIPATVLSRCQTVYLSLVADAEMASALLARGMDAEAANEIVGFAAGRPGVALQLMEADVLQAYREHKHELDELLQSTLAEKLGRLTELSKKSKAELESQLSVWEILLHQQGQHKTLKQLIRARSAMRQNVNVTLALEHAFI